MGKYWKEIDKSLKRIKENEGINDVKYKQDFIKEATTKLKKTFHEFMKSIPQIMQSNFHQVMEENVKPGQKLEVERAIVLEWGNKIKPTEKEIAFLESNYKNSFLNLFRSKNIPEIILKSDYYYICFHLNNHDIFFPHNREFTSIPLSTFINNPKIILPRLEYCLTSPQRNNKILKKGIDYRI